MKSDNTIQVAIVDYGLGNLFSVNQACRHVGLSPVITDDPVQIAKADALILPGVGAFGDAMKSLNEKNLATVIKDFVATGKPFMGVCLGMQSIFSESEEFGSSKGLDLIKGKVVKFPTTNPEGKKLRIPHIGWNKILKPTGRSWDNSPLTDYDEDTYMYFIHSFFVVPENDSSVLAYSEYEGIKFCSSIMQGNIFAAQFHPEKSTLEGLKVYEKFKESIINKEIIY